MNEEKSIKRTKKIKQRTKDIEKALGAEYSIGKAYTEGDYRYFEIKDCYGNDYLVQELERITRFQWRVFGLNNYHKTPTKKYYEISGANQADFKKLWLFLIENKITLSP